MAKTLQEQELAADEQLAEQRAGYSAAELVRFREESVRADLAAGGPVCIKPPSGYEVMISAELARELLARRRPRW